MKLRTKNDKPCVGVLKSGLQCPNPAVEGTDKCRMHGGLIIKKSKEKKITNQMTANFMMERVKRMNKSSEIGNLRQEVAVLKVLLETQLNKCKSEVELLMYAPQVQSIIHSIEKVLTSCLKLERMMGELLNKDQIYAFSDNIIKIIIDNVENPESISKIISQMEELLIKQGEEIDWKI